MERVKYNAERDPGWYRFGGCWREKNLDCDSRRRIEEQNGVSSNISSNRDQGWGEIKVKSNNFAPTVLWVGEVIQPVAKF